ncbi:MAG: VWA domain-containing protein [Methylococcaceae bacterium]|nr:VWA domain-containing protein [Methylococcaceae bacterium]
MLILWLRPMAVQKSPTYNFTVIIDITRSMNATDYPADTQAISRLEHVKNTLRQLIAQLPCESKIGLGLFTERRSTLLFEPLEVCHSFAEIDAAISHIDWRMAWAADSNIAKGLLSTLDMLQNSDSQIIFITDGQEAPPVNPNYRADFSTLKNKAKGLILGAGGLAAVPIPKFDEQGKANGFYTVDDVPHRSSFGQSNLDPSQIEGYNARNAPFGSAAVKGTEHLTALHEDYLKQLATESGLAYARLTDLAALQETLQTGSLAIEKPVATDVRWQPALLALAMLALIYWPRFFNLRRRS